MAAKHVGILRCHMFDEIFLVGNLDHIFSDMRRISRRREQHYHLQFGGVDLAIALVGKRDELVGDPCK